MSAVAGLVPVTVCRAFDAKLKDPITNDFDLEYGFTNRLRKGFAIPNGALFWSMYLSDVTEDAWALGRELLADHSEWFNKTRYLPPWTRDSQLFERLVMVRPGTGWWDDLPTKRRRQLKDALAECKLVDCGNTISRDYSSFDWACARMVSKDHAKLMAAPELLRPLLPQYIDLLVAANNAVHTRWHGLKNGVATPYEVSLIRAHEFSEQALLEIAQSPIAALFLAQHADPAELAAVQQRNLRQAA